MTETEFNAVLRTILRCGGLRALHIREADLSGVSDLVVWQGRALVAWCELKIDNNEVEGHQHQFLMDREAEGGYAYLIRLSNMSGLVRVSKPVPEGFVHLFTLDNYRTADWIGLFRKYRREI